MKMIQLLSQLLEQVIMPPISNSIALAALTNDLDNITIAGITDTQSNIAGTGVEDSATGLAELKLYLRQ